MTNVSDSDGNLIAIVFSLGEVDQSQHARFFTDQSLPLQCGALSYAAQTNVHPHTHSKMDIRIERVTEFIGVVSGEFVVVLYDRLGRYVNTIRAGVGTGVYLASGGHSVHSPNGGLAFYCKQGPHDQGDKIPIYP